MRQSVNSSISSSIFVPACGKDKPLWCSLLKLSLGDWSAWGCSLHNAGGYWKAPAWLKITFYDSDTWPTGCVFYIFLQSEARTDQTWKGLVIQGAWNLQNPSDSGKLKTWMNIHILYMCIYIYTCIHIYIYMIYIHMACIYIYILCTYIYIYRSLSLSPYVCTLCQTRRSTPVP